MIFHRILLAGLACCLISFGARAQEEFHPIAHKDALVVAGNARFTILTPRLIRMEWAEDGFFEDRASLGIVNRELTVPAFKVRQNAKRTVITTDALTLTYTGTGKFDENNLTVDFRMAGPADRKGRPTTLKKRWHPGLDDSGNLLGTARTLDGFD